MNENSFAQYGGAWYFRPMTNLVLGQVAFFDLDAQDDAGISHHANFNVQVADYSLGYVALLGANRIFFVPKTPGTVTIAITGTSQDGTALPTVTIEYQTVPASGPTQASKFVPGPITVAPSDIATPSDPGVDTVTGSL